ncbi:MAG: isochorismatase family protein, partial [Betaproteobacteria bacterium]
MTHPPIAITQGDPAGIGPEIIAKAFRDAPEALRGCFVVGDVACLRRASALIGSPAALPLPDEPVCARPCESAFFSTDLERMLTTGHAQSLIVCGAPTSGALRASVIESKSYGYKVALAEEAVGDESIFLHKIALFD